MGEEFKEGQIWKTPGPLHHQAYILSIAGEDVKFSYSEETDHGIWCGGKDTLTVAEFVATYPVRHR